MIHVYEMYSEVFLIFYKCSLLLVTIHYITTHNYLYRLNDMYSNMKVFTVRQISVSTPTELYLFI